MSDGEDPVDSPAESPFESPVKEDHESESGSPKPFSFSLPSLDNDGSRSEDEFVELPQAAYDAADDYLLCSVCGKTEGREATVLCITCEAQFCGYCDEDKHDLPENESHERESLESPSGIAPL